MKKHKLSTKMISMILAMVMLIIFTSCMAKGNSNAPMADGSMGN